MVRTIYQDIYVRSASKLFRGKKELIKLLEQS
ncbi:MAG: hypothetical protein ACJAY7_001299 [Pseudohongiellaceae bacterium]|jgi:hypothetical protein